MIFMIIFIFSFITGITANSYCDQQLNQLCFAANNIRQSCSLASKFAVILMILVSLLCTPTAIYQMQYWYGGIWSTTSDTQSADGGWIVIQRRQDGSVDFNQPWSDYEKGFGDLNGDFWYGLKSISYLTQTGQWELRVDFEFQNNTKSYLHYNVFKVGSATDEYPLTISGFTGITPTDPFAAGRHNGQKFSTYDNDNDKFYEGNCAAHVQVGEAKGNGGWWYNNCWAINLNYKNNPEQHGFIVLANYWYNPRRMEMKIHPLNWTS